MADKKILADQQNEENPKVVKAKVGDTIQIKRGSRKGKKAKVIGIRENSAIVELGINYNTGEPIKTVINHKNYKLVK